MNINIYVSIMFITYIFIIIVYSNEAFEMWVWKIMERISWTENKHGGTYIGGWERVRI